MRKRLLDPAGLPRAAAWLPVAMNLWEIAVTAPQVMALRSARLLGAGPFPSARDQRELVRMFEEKTEAFVESMTAMALELFAVHQSLAASLFRMPWPYGLAPLGLPVARRRRSLARLVAIGVAPTHRRVKANALRLRRG
jgi:hypothetical protein